MPENPPTKPQGRARFRRTLVRVLLVQALAMIALAVLQLRYGA